LSDERTANGWLRRALRLSGDQHDIVVIGLGRFGSSLGAELVVLGHRVLGIDADAELVQRQASIFTQTVAADATDIEALRQLGVQDFSNAVVAIGTDIESSVLCVAALNDLGIRDIWAKAVSDAHGRILERVGADHVVQPERDMGVRTARQVVGRMVEYLPLDDQLSLAEVTVPKAFVGKTLMQLAVRSRHDVTVVCVKPVGGSFAMATADTSLGAKDLLVVAGAPDSVSAFADLER
jgi:trk system potassium uptake protein TrkA